jgi:hypothetical protein
MTEFVRQGVDGEAVEAVIRLVKEQTQSASANRADRMLASWVLGKMRPSSNCSGSRDHGFDLGQDVGLRG